MSLRRWAEAVSFPLSSFRTTQYTYAAMLPGPIKIHQIVRSSKWRFKCVCVMIDSYGSHQEETRGQNSGKICTTVVCRWLCAHKIPCKCDVEISWVFAYEYHASVVTICGILVTICGICRWDPPSGNMVSRESRGTQAAQVGTLPFQGLVIFLTKWSAITSMEPVFKVFFLIGLHSIA